MFAGKKITIGISGGIAAYRAADIVSWLVAKGAEVHCAMTAAATHFITPLTLKTLSQQPVCTDLMTVSADWQVPHIDLAACDLYLVLPATANLLAKAAHGLADDVVSASLLACKAPILAVPAMNSNMYENPATEENRQTLLRRGWQFVEPGYGRLACGIVGRGHIAFQEEIQSAVCAALDCGPLLAGKRVLVTAGPTYEYLDPVRFLGNRSSGKMGVAVAEAAAAAGAEVTLVLGPTMLADPPGLRTLRVTSAAEMYDAVWSLYADTDVVVMAAAVADYRPESVSAEKIKKGGAAELKLVRTEDILCSLGKNKGARFLCGFAAETQNLEAYAAGKLAEKNLDLLVANNVAEQGAGFDGDTNIVTLFWSGGKEAWPLQSKREIGQRLIRKIAEQMLDKC